MQTIVVNPAGTIAYVAGNSGGTYSVDLLTGARAVHSINGTRGAGPVMSWINGLAMNAAGTKLFAVEYFMGFVTEIDIATGDRVRKSSDGSTYAAIGGGVTMRMATSGVLSADETKLFTISALSKSLISIDLATGNRTVVSSDTGAVVGTGPEINGSTSGFFLNAAQTKAYAGNMDALSNHYFLEIDMATGNRINFASRSVGAGGADWAAPYGVAPDVTGDYFYISDYGLGDLVKVKISDGSRTIVKDRSIGSGPDISNGVNSVLSMTNEKVFLTSKSSLFSVNTINGDRTLLSGLGRGTGTAFSNISSLHINQSETKAYILDACGSVALGAIISVDLINGNRTILSSGSVGTGTALSASTCGFAVNTDESLAFAFDYTTKVVFKIDLTTGNRTVVSDAVTGTGTVFNFPYGISISTNQQKLYVVDLGAKLIYEVDIATGNRTVISSNSVGTGTNFNSPGYHWMNTAENTLYVYDSTSGILKVDLATGNRSVLAASPPWCTFKNIHPNNKIYFGAHGGLVELNLLTGDRMLISK